MWGSFVVGIHRKVAIINLDPANDSLPYPFPLYLYMGDYSVFIILVGVCWDKVSFNEII